MTDLEQEARELARESGWPDEMYLGLMQMAQDQKIIGPAK